MITVFCAGKTGTVPVECETPGWPNTDIDGNQMYDNTHFLTEAEAWKRVIADADAHVELETRHVQHLRQTLQAAEKDLVEAVLKQREAIGNHRDWQQKQLDEAATGNG